MCVTYPAEKRVYVAYGGDEEGGIAVIDAASGKRLDDVAKLDAHPESFQIATSKPVIYATSLPKRKLSSGVAAFAESMFASLDTGSIPLLAPPQWPHRLYRHE